MATKKKARKKKAAVARPVYPQSRILSVNKLTQLRACFSSRIRFVNAFQSFGDVAISERLVRGMSDEALLQIGYPPASYILTWEGRVKFNRALARAGIVDYRTGDKEKTGDKENLRAYLVTLARHYVRFGR